MGLFGIGTNTDSPVWICSYSYNNKLSKCRKKNRIITNTNQTNTVSEILDNHKNNSKKYRHRPSIRKHKGFTEKGRGNGITNKQVLIRNNAEENS